MSPAEAPGGSGGTLYSPGSCKGTASGLKSLHTPHLTFHLTLQLDAILLVYHTLLCFAYVYSAMVSCHLPALLWAELAPTVLARVPWMLHLDFVSARALP